jgi:hypothetical protein
MPLIAPITGRKFTASQLSSAAIVRARVKNLDDAPVAGFTVNYRINGGSIVSESVVTPLAGGAVYVHDFAATADLSAVGNYNLEVWVKNNVTDPVPQNDTIRTLVRQLNNLPLTVSPAFVDNMEPAVAATYVTDTTGLFGLDRYDFSRTTPYGRLRSFVNSGMAYSGTKALTLDVDRYFLRAIPVT